MNDEQHTYWHEYIRHLADHLKLRDWDILLDRGEPENPGAFASCGLRYGQRRADIYLSVKFYAHTPENQRWICVHELLHCHFDPLDDAMTEIACRLGDDTADNLVRSLYKRQREHTLDHIATAIAPFLPLPVPSIGGIVNREEAA